MGRLYQVPAHPKEIIDGTMDGEKLLNLSGGFKAAHVAFALAGGLMRHLSPVVRILIGTVLDRGEGGPMSSGIATQLVGDESGRNVS